MKRVYRWLLPCLTLAACESTFQTEDGTVEEANEALLAGQVDNARARYDEAAATLPESPSLNYLRGLAASATGEHKAAHDLLLRALDTKDKALEQRVKAALGLAYAREAIALERAGEQAAQPEGPAGAEPPASALETWKLAVGFLEDALVLDPSDMESRRTLEVALLRVDPPCATRDDELEPNNSREDAKPLTLGGGEGEDGEAAGQPRDVLRARQQLFSCPDNDDWLALDLSPGDRVELAATLPKDAGLLAFTLHGPNGERLHELAPTGEKLRFTVAPDLGGRWTLHVQNVDLDEVSYGIEALVRPACEKTEDSYEDNDSAFQAKPVQPGPLSNLKSCPGDEDWFSLTLSEGESVFVFAQPDAPKEEDSKDKARPKDEAKVPALELELMDEEGLVRAIGAPTGIARVSTLLTPGPGRYLVRVRSAPTGFGPDRNEPFEGRYTLQLEVVPACPEGDDRFEDNDLPENATDFAQAAAPPEPQGQGGIPLPQQGGPPAIFARICPGDSDWWSFTSTGEKPELITATFDHAKGDLDLLLFDDAGAEVARSAVSTAELNGEALALPLDEELAEKKRAGATGDELQPTPKTWRLQVRGQTDEDQNFYLLKLDQPSGGGGDSSEDGEPEDQDSQESRDPSDSQDQGDQKDQQDQSESQPNPLQDALDNLDKNPENLPARDAATRSPLANQKPLKDW